MESSNSNSKERELQLTQRLAKQRHSNCMTWFEQLETHLHDLYLLNSPYAVDAFKPAFRSFFSEEHQTFKLKMFHNLDQLRLQLERENLHGVNANTREDGEYLSVFLPSLLHCPELCFGSLCNYVTEGSWGFEHTKAVFINEVIPFLKSLKDIFNAFDTNLINEITEVQTVFNQMEAAVEQCSDIVNIVTSCVVNESVNMNNCVNEKCSKCLELETGLIKKSDMIERDVFDKLSEHYLNLEKHCISVESTMKLNQEIFQNDKFYKNQQAPTFNQFIENELRKPKEKNVVDTIVSTPIATTITPGKFKLDIEPISHRLKNNRTHEDYLKKTIENTDTICGLVEHARKQNPSEPILDSPCRFTKHVQELLIYVSKTCPSLTKPSEKLVVATPMNKTKKVTFAELVTSSSNIPRHTDSLKTRESNKPLLPSTGVNSSINAKAY
ncbi:hypothetical protein Tco_0031049 [Tanacetum coccineum]